MIPRSAYLSLAGIVAFATAVTFAASAAAQAPGNAGATGTSVRADLVPAPARESLTGAERPISGNPLWAIPLKQLSHTRDRPIFSPLRRPPPPAVVDRPFVPPPVVRPAPPRPPERPSLALLGTIAGENEGIALFMETTSQMVVRLRTGEAHEGWVLRSVHGREAMLEKGNRTETVTLPDPGSGTGEAPTPEVIPQAPQPWAGVPRRQPR
jgi:general secretion pathway protein N